MMRREFINYKILLPYSLSKFLDKIYKLSNVLYREDAKNGIIMKLESSTENKIKIKKILEYK